MFAIFAASNIQIEAGDAKFIRTLSQLNTAKIAIISQNPPFFDNKINTNK